MSDFQRARAALQLWSVRELTARDLRTTLADVAEAGFDGVETWWGDMWFNWDVDWSARQLADLGLEVCAAHVARSPTPQADTLLDYAQRLGAPVLVLTGATNDPRDGDADGLRRMIEEINVFSELTVAAGMSVGLHLHDWEMLDREGEPTYVTLDRELAPSVALEVDTFAASQSNVDLAGLLGSLGSRVSLLHLKDGPVEAYRALHSGDAHFVDALQTAWRSAPQTAVGAGTVPIDDALAAATRARWLIVEIDSSPDVMTAARQSLAYVRARLSASA